jgi:hypothetical protein
MNNKIKNFSTYNKEMDIAMDFVENLTYPINESIDDIWKTIQDRVLKDISVNLKYVGSFGAGIGAFYPVVIALMENMGQSLEVDKEMVVLATICALTIIYLDEKNNLSENERMIITKDSKSMLEELRMRGVGNGIIKKLVKVIHSIKHIFDKLSRYLGIVAIGFLDMFGYTSILIPILNGIKFIVGKYNLNIDTLLQNLFGLSIGVVTIITKIGIEEIVKRLSGKIKPEIEDKILSDISDEVPPDLEFPMIKRFQDIEYDDTELIKEK